MNPKLTVIIPVRINDDRSDILDRLKFSLEDPDRPSEVEFLVIDDGSPSSTSYKIKQICLENGFKYFRSNTELNSFSIARSRNIGAMQATSDYILFQDVDLIPYPGFYRDALKEILVQGLDQNSELFIMFGVVYLSEEATAEFFRTDPEFRKETFLHRVHLGDRGSVIKTSTGTSVTIFNREYYLSRGGNSEDFYDWGFEDLEFVCRCLQRSAVFPMPNDFHAHYRNFENITEYKGWKAPYRLFGDMTFQKGKVLFHAWHPVDVKSTYLEAKNRNELLFDAKMAAYAKKGIDSEPAPLPSICEGRTLVFSKTNPFVYNRDTLSRLGEVFVENESSFTPLGLAEYVQQHEISRVLFHNPYANPCRRSLYEAVRRLKIPYLVAERGALPDSVFFDRNGFLADSCSYAAEKWDFPLSPFKKAAVEEYIRRERQEDNALETQGNRIGAASLRRKLGVQPDQKVLFVPLQRPADTVIKYQCGPIGTFDNFLSLVAEVREKLGRDWAVIIKKHPLEDESPEVPDAIYADEAHVKDLLEMSDAVLLINSGVGILSMIWEKPVFYAGDAWYGHPGVNSQVTTASELVNSLRSLFLPDREKIFRFLSYLLHDFYSFGHFTTREVTWPEGGRMTITKAIEFYQIRGLGRSPFNARREKIPIIPINSLLFDRYRNGGQQFQRSPVVNKNITTSCFGHFNFARKYRKLRTNPRRFFSDSNYVALRAIGRVLFSRLPCTSRRGS